MRTKIYPYKQGSNSARSLANELGCRVLKVSQSSSAYRPRVTDRVINWGSSGMWFDPSSVSIINLPDRVAEVTNKLRFFQGSVGCEGYQTPEFTTDSEVAKTWPTCVSRTLLQASGGRGIVITNEGEEPPRASLYVKYEKKNREFRIHVMSGRVFDTQRKIKDPNIEEPESWQVRNHSNGFIFARESGEPSQSAKDAAIACVQHFGLDFGAVDIIEKRNGDVYVLEVNTAPGLEGTTLQNYAREFNNEYNV